MTDAIAAPRLVDGDVPDDALGERLTERRIAVASRADGRPVLLRPDSVLAKAVDDDAVDRVADAAQQAGLAMTLTDDGAVRRIGDYVRLDVEPDEIGTQRRRWSVRPVAESIERLAARGIKLKPNHVYLANDLTQGLLGPRHPSVLANAWARDTDPVRTTARPALASVMPPPLDLADRRTPRVLILDTGLRAVRHRRRWIPEHPALRDRVRIHDPWRVSGKVRGVDDDDEPHADRDGAIDVCAGHGTFIAGIVRQVCPDAEIHVDGVLTSFGDGDDDTVEAGIRRAARRLRPDVFDVIVLSLGAYTADDRFPPLAAAVRRVAAHPRTIVVASAGNAASARPYFPAAIPEVVAVGALDGAGRAWFSNFGGWVDACAPGVDVVSTYFCDAEDRDGARVTRFHGWAAWNGTSFAAPRVAATIAQDMYINGGSAKDAWRRLSGWGRQRQPDLGVVFDVP